MCVTSSQASPGAGLSSSDMNSTIAASGSSELAGAAGSGFFTCMSMWRTLHLNSRSYCSA